MKMRKKVIAVALACAMLLSAVGGTLAWLTDKDSVKNVFSVGSVNIDLTEENKLNGTDISENSNPSNSYNYKFESVMPGDVITKKPTIKNEGSNSAYVRVVVEVKNEINDQELLAKVREYLNSPNANPKLVTLMDYSIDSVFENKYGKDSEAYNNFYNTLFDGWGIDYRKSAETGGRAEGMIRFAMNQRTDDKVKHIDSLRVMDDDGSWQFNAQNKFQSDNEKQNLANGFGGIGYMNGGQESYYKGLMTTGEGKLVYVFYLELDAGEEYTLFNGFKVPEQFDTQSLAFFNGLEVNVYADAIQTQGFEDGTDGTKAWENAINALNEQHSLADLIAGN